MEKEKRKKGKKNNSAMVVDDEISDNDEVIEIESKTEESKNLKKNVVDINAEEENMSEDDLEDLHLKDLETNEKIREILAKVRNLDVKKEIGEKEKMKESRLVIEQIELENFKSYQGRKVIGPLYYKFNAVVGPNGSGKSNLMESLLFVFGKRATKMRLKKLSELIHKSTEHPNIKYARVSVYFKEIYDNEDGTYSDIPDSEFILSREVNKSSASKYFINRKETTFEELCPILEQHGIDLKHNRFLILQGEVEQISMLAPKAKPNSKETGLLEFLEDIIGTKRYVNIISKLSTYTEEITELKVNKEKLVKLTKTDLDKLEDIKSVSIMYFNEELNKFYVEYLLQQLKIYNQDNLVKECDKKIGEFNLQKEENHTKVTKLKEENQETINHLRSKKEEITKIKSALDAIKKQEDDLAASDENLRGEIKDCEKDIKKQEDIRAKLNNQLNEVMEKNTEANNNFENVRSNCSQKENNIKILEEEIKKIEISVSDETRNLNEKKRELITKMNPVIKEIESLNFESKQNEQTYNMIIKSLESKEEKLKKILELENSLKDDINKKEKATKEINEKMVSIKNSVSSSNQELKNINQQIDIKKKEYEEVSKKLHDAEGEKKEYMQRTNLINDIMKAQQSGYLKGVIGRIGDLGAIHQDYDIAISTVCPQLDFLAVHTVEDAEMCIKFLKEKRLGSATFVVLDKQQHLWDRIQSNFRCPDNTKRLFDLISPNKKDFLPLFYYCLGNTLVAPNTKVANEVGYGENRHKVVTLQGTIVDPMGSMSGGGQPRKGLMSNKKGNMNEISPEELRELQNLKDKFYKEIENLYNQKSIIEKKIQQFNQDISHSENNLKFLDNEISMLQKKELDTTKQKHEAENDLKKYSSEREKLKDLEKKDEKVMNDIKQLEEKIKPERQSLEKIEAELNKIKGVNFNEKVNQLKRLREEHSTLEKKLLEYETIKEECPIKLKKLENDIRIIDGKIVTLKELITTKSKDLEGFETKYMELVKEKEDTEKKSQLASKEYEEIIKKSKKFKEDLEKFNVESKKIDSEIEKINKDKNEKLKSRDFEIDKTENTKKNYNKFIEEYGFISDIEKEIETINNERKKRKSEVIAFLNLSAGKPNKINEAPINGELEKINEDQNDEENSEGEDVNENKNLNKKVKLKGDNINESLKQYLSSHIFSREFDESDFKGDNSGKIALCDSEVS